MHTLSRCMNRRVFLALASALPIAPCTAAVMRRFQSTMERVNVLELYTSEGCSSCPPADESFSRLKQDADLWSKLIPLAFHVDYWDYLGWKDPFANAKHSSRQRRYAAKWQARTVYTPGLVLNGQESRSLKASSAQTLRPGVLSLTEQDTSTWQLKFAPRADLTGLRYHLALLGFDLTSKVTHGENAGSTLTHDFVVLEHLTSTTGTMKSQTKGAGAIAAWVSLGDDPTPVQATGGWLR